MASVYSLQDLTLFFSEKDLLSHVTATISDGDRIGIVGRNGSGKSTFLRLLAGDLEPDQGQIIRRNHLTVAYLPQTPLLNDNESITAAAMHFIPSHEGRSDDTAEYEAQRLLTSLGFSDLSQSVSTLSGGQRIRVALAGIFCRNADVLLLDEPTNHIDIETTEWLEAQLQAFHGTLITVTHDRILLSRVFNRIFLVEGGKVSSFQTDYAGYLEERAAREDMEAATLRKQKALYRHELQWIRRGAQARSTKAKGRIEQFEHLEEAIQEKPELGKAAIKSASSRLGKKTLSCQHLFAGHEKTVLIEDFSYTLLRDDRIGILGLNGCGKTTLLQTLAGLLPPISGQIEVGETVKIGYFSQHPPLLSPDERVIDAVKDVAVHVVTPDGQMSASQMLESFLFPSTQHFQKISSLSGGELRRLHLLRVLMTAPNILILDEPSNDLDIETLEVLEDYIDHFEGAVIVVSHDRYFLDRVATKFFAFKDRKLQPLNGSYSDWLQTLSSANVSDKQTEKKTIVRAIRTDNYDHRFSFREQRDYDTIEEKIAEKEQSLVSLQEAINAHASDYVRVQELMRLQQEEQAGLDALLERWIYLQDKFERIQSETHPSAKVPKRN